MALSDIEIAQKCKMKKITSVAKQICLDEKYLEQYGNYKAKIDLSFLKETKKENGKLVLVTAINPTASGEGKTTTSIGLVDALNSIGKKTVAALREPSLGPVFGLKGGAAGGGYAQVVPMEDINLHFTGDFHAITSANNLICAMLDNHIQQGNELSIDPRSVVIKRCMDINDRQLRNIVDGLGGTINGTPREDGFDITVATEVMAVFCLSSSISDLKDRLSKMVIAYTYSKKPVTCADIKAVGAAAALLKDALKPNLVQTLEGNAAIVHGGPFANIAHGCNSVLATKVALKLGDYAVTEAGFGADLGAEKFLDIKCRAAEIKPNAVVIVATVRALKMHGGAEKKDLSMENLQALENGCSNLLRHISNIKNVYHLPCVVALNRFPTDTQNEINLVAEKCKGYGAKVCLSDVWAKGGEGGVELAKEVVRLCEEESNSNFTYCYDENDTLEEKIEKIVKKIYGGDSVEYTPAAKKQLAELKANGFGSLPVCMAKTPYSFSDDAKLVGAPTGFKIYVKSVKVSAGAGFVVVLTGNIMTMPGLPKVPAAQSIDVDENGKITGLF